MSPRNSAAQTLDYWTARSAAVATHHREAAERMEAMVAEAREAIADQPFEYRDDILHALTDRAKAHHGRALSHSESIDVSTVANELWKEYSAANSLDVAQLHRPLPQHAALTRALELRRSVTARRAS